LTKFECSVGIPYLAFAFWGIYVIGKLNWACGLVQGISSFLRFSSCDYKIPFFSFFFNPEYSIKSRGKIRAEHRKADFRQK